jgi:hypothetical protein
VRRMLGVVAADEQGLWRSGAFRAGIELDGYLFGLALGQIEGAAAARDAERWSESSYRYLQRGLALVFDFELFGRGRVHFDRAETQVAGDA